MLRQVILKSSDEKKKNDVKSILNLFIINNDTRITSIDDLTLDIYPSSIIIVHNDKYKILGEFLDTCEIKSESEKNLLKFEYEKYDLDTIYLFPKEYNIHNKNYVLVAKLLVSKPFVNKGYHSEVIIRPSIEKNVYYRVSNDKSLRCLRSNLNVLKSNNPLYIPDCKKSACFDNFTEIAIYHILSF